MPLKHGQETRLVFFLGVAIVAAGVAIATLPPLPEGALQWSGAFLISFLYPLLLHPLLRKHRADYAFRMLHWMPMWILIIWLVLQLIGLFISGLSFLVLWVSWGWALPLVTLGFFSLFVFCMHVIRCRKLRVTLLALTFLPFAVLAILSEQSDIDFNRKIVATVWNAPMWEMLEQAPEMGGNHSQVASNENQEPIDRDEPDASSSSSDAKEIMELMPPLPSALQPGGTGAHMRDIESKPNGLPQSGFGWSAIIVLLLAAYCGTLHAKWKVKQ